MAEPQISQNNKKNSEFFPEPINNQNEMQEQENNNENQLSNEINNNEQMNDENMRNFEVHSPHQQNRALESNY